MIWCGKQPYQWSSQRLSSSLPPWNGSMARVSRTCSGLSAVPAHYLITSSFKLQSSVSCQTDKQFLVQFELPFAVCCCHGTTLSPKPSLAWPNKLHLDLYNQQSAFISMMERQFSIKFQSGLLAQRDSKASDHRGKSCYLDEALFVYIMQLDICVNNCIQTGRSGFDFIYNQIHLHCTYIFAICC